MGDSPQKCKCRADSKATDYDRWRHLLLKVETKAGTPRSTVTEVHGSLLVAHKRFHEHPATFQTALVSTMYRIALLVSINKILGLLL